VEPKAKFCNACGEKPFKKDTRTSKEGIDEVKNSINKILCKWFPGVENPEPATSSEYFLKYFQAVLCQLPVHAISFIFISVLTRSDFLASLIGTAAGIYVFLRVWLPTYFGRLKHIGVSGTQWLYNKEGMFVAAWLISGVNPVINILFSLSLFIALIVIGFQTGGSDSDRGEPDSSADGSDSEADGSDSENIINNGLRTIQDEDASLQNRFNMRL